MKTVFCFLFLILGSPPAGASSWFEKKLDSGFLYDKFKAAGVPLPALERTFEFLDLNENKSFSVPLGEDRTAEKRITNKNYAVIINYSQPSDERRLYLLNLRKGTVEKYYVAHGVRSGRNSATRFANVVDSRKTSLGIYLTGSNYEGSHGDSLYLHGLEPSNSKAFERYIVMHGAPYVSMEFLEKYGRMGRSWGCPAVSQAVNKKLIPLIKGGALVYAYHKDLMLMAQTSPAIQNMGDNQEKAPNDSDEVVPEELNP